MEFIKVKALLNSKRTGIKDFNGEEVLVLSGWEDNGWRYSVILPNDKTCEVRHDEISVISGTIEGFDKDCPEKKLHYLKIRPWYADPVAWGNKTFEIRKNDRDFKEGDIIRFTVLGTNDITGHNIILEEHPLNGKEYDITYVLKDITEYGLAEGYAVLAIRPANEWNEINNQVRDLSRAVSRLRELVMKKAGEK